METQNMIEFGITDCLTEASLGWKSFGKKIKNREIYTFNERYVRFYT